MIRKKREKNTLERKLVTKEARENVPWDTASRSPARRHLIVQEPRRIRPTVLVGDLSRTCVSVYVCISVSVCSPWLLSVFVSRVLEYVSRCCSFCIFLLFDCSFCFLFCLLRPLYFRQRRPNVSMVSLVDNAFSPSLLRALSKLEGRIASLSWLNALSLSFRWDSEVVSPV